MFLMCLATVLLICHLVLSDHYSHEKLAVMMSRVDAVFAVIDSLKHVNNPRHNSIQCYMDEKSSVEEVKILNACFESRNVTQLCG